LQRWEGDVFKDEARRPGRAGYSPSTAPRWAQTSNSVPPNAGMVTLFHWAAQTA
jgi:hypothetical protein